jgi:hypothetical protein
VRGEIEPFPGNRDLARNRAAAAETEYRRLLLPLTIGAVPVVGQSEMYNPRPTRPPPEPSGAELETHATERFRNADELGPRTAAARAAFDAQPGATQLDQAYRAMRRAQIQLHRDVVVRAADPGTPPLPERPEAARGCPPEVRQLAARQLDNMLDIPP